MRAKNIARTKGKTVYGRAVKTWQVFGGVKILRQQPASGFIQRHGFYIQ